MIQVKQKGNFNLTKKFLTKATNFGKTLQLNSLDRIGKEGVRALSQATPVDSGTTADSWYYKIERNEKEITISWCNSNIIKGIPIAIILQYGHATGGGGYVRGRDYINPAIQPIFDKLAKKAWEEVTK